MLNRREDLSKLLANRISRMSLREYLKYRYCDEFIEFWERSRALNRLYELNVEKQQQVIDLVEEFVNVSGEKSLNLSWNVRYRLIHAVEACDYEEAMAALKVCMESVEEMIHLNFLSGFLEDFGENPGNLREDKKPQRLRISYSNPPSPTRSSFSGIPGLKKAKSFTKSSDIPKKLSAKKKKKSLKLKKKEKKNKTG
eukprot:TRINITY_DN1834_c0_g1_i1.p1 TRINITY_DN1834_c0_g1~~TRINITY_DN1834_c0_g1_i1.p1  ORF type:complete len:197 (-),score=45.27 TRINITY_DN1834_c0_g1_i1:96-686(-)